MRDGNEMAPDLSWSEVDVFECDLLTATICYSIRHKHMSHTSRNTDASGREQLDILLRDYNRYRNSEERTGAESGRVVSTHLENTHTHTDRYRSGQSNSVCT